MQQTKVSPYLPSPWEETAGSRDEEEEEEVEGEWGRRGRGEAQDTFSEKERTQMLVKTPAYTLTRSANKMTMDINAAAFFGETQQKVERCKSVDIPAVSNEARVKALLAEAVKAREAMQRDLVELNVRLEQQQQNHDEYISQLEQAFQEKQENVAKSHEKAIRELKDKHCKDEKDLIEKYELELQALQQLWGLERETLEGELEATKQLMEEVKVEMAAKAEEKLQNREQELQRAHEEELREQEQRLSRWAEEEVAGVRELLTLQHSKELERLAADHQQQKRDLLDQLDDAAKLERQLSISNRRVKKLEGEVENFKRTLEENNSQQLTVESKLLDTQRKLREYERNFNAKVQCVEGSYKDRLDGLRRENSQLRGRLMHKTEQHSQYRAAMENSQAKTIRTYQDRMTVILRARSRAELCTMEAAKPRSKKLTQRPHSAPALCATTSTAAAETSTVPRSQLVQEHTRRPGSSLANI